MSGEERDPDPFERIREHEEAIEAVAERDDKLGATARCLLKWSRGEQPWKDTVEASHFDLDVGGNELGMWSPTYSGPRPALRALETAVSRVLAVVESEREE